MYRSSRRLQQASTNMRDPTANPSVAGGTPGASGTLCRVAKKINKPPGQQKTSRPVFVPVKRCNAIPILSPVYLACPCTIQRGNYVTPTDFWVRSLKTNQYLLSLSLSTYTRISCEKCHRNSGFCSSFPTLLGILFQKFRRASRMSRFWQRCSVFFATHVTQRLKALRVPQRSCLCWEHAGGSALKRFEWSTRLKQSKSVCIYTCVYDVYIFTKLLRFVWLPVGWSHSIGILWVDCHKFWTSTYHDAHRILTRACLCWRPY